MLMHKALFYFLFLACCFQHYEATINVSLMGRTGDGKSAFGNLLYRLSGGEPNIAPFSESSSLYRGPQSQSVMVQDLKITELYGLVDVSGTILDDKNFVSSLNSLKEENVVHGFLLVINEQAPYFGSGCQDALKLIVDLFGLEILSVMGVVFTRSYSNNSDDSVNKFMSEVLRPTITNMTGVDVSAMPFWQVDTHPETLWADYPDKLSWMETRNQRAVDDIRRWASGNHPVDASKPASNI